jgi:hypothetical protein
MLQPSKRREAIGESAGQEQAAGSIDEIFLSTTKTKPILLFSSKVAPKISILF